MSSKSGSSGNQINYYARPCKSIERKMMCDIISCYKALYPGAEFRYIGMGAKYFVDFVLFHKMFGFNEMVSIEKRASEQARLEFNKPFNCIDLKIMDVSSFFSSSMVKWKEKKNVIWVDYDGGLTGQQIEDIGLGVGRIEDTSILFVSTNVNLGEKYESASPIDKLDIFKQRINKDSLTNHLTARDLAGKGKLAEIRNAFNNEIVEVLANKNASLSDEDCFVAEQIAFFRYADSTAEMITLGWIIYRKSESNRIAESDVISLPFSVSDEEPYDISIDLFTYKELSVLNKNMPNITHPIKDAPFITKEEIENYQKVYRYYPTLMETNVVL